MPDLSRMDRTWLCSVVFTDIANYSSQSVELQMKLKARFNGYLANAIRDTPEDERVILDTGDGAAICFLGAPEAAMFAALELWHSLLHDEREQQIPLRVRIGINLGPVKLVKDINGALNALGDGMNAGQRIMSFAAENQILVSQSFFEVVSRLSDDYKDLFKLKGVETDKHVREHTVYKLLPPGGEKTQAFAVAANLEMKPAPAASEASATTANAKASAPAKQEGNTRSGSRTMVLLIAGIAVVVIAAASAWRFFGATATSTPSVNSTPAQQPPPQQESTATSPAAAPDAAAPSSAPASASTPSASPGKSAPVDKPAPARSAPAVTASSNPPAKQPEAPVPVASVPKENPPPASAPSAAPATPVASDPTAGYNAAFSEGMRLLDQDKAAEAVRHFDDAIRAKPDFIEALVFRAEARRNLAQYEMSLEDCNKIIQIKPDEPRGYNCRGLSHQLLKQFDASLPDFAEAIRRNPNFALAFANRGTTYNLMRQYERAIPDFDEALRLQPRNAVFHLKRGNSYGNLKQWDKAIRDYSEAIRLQPNNLNAYRQRAVAEEASGDSAGAAADRARAQGGQGRRN
jgi:class 3 adenylate cyclase/Tfp pilus assembly protein PilF